MACHVYSLDHAAREYPFEGMAVGDYFICPDCDAAMSATACAEVTHPGMEFAAVRSNQRTFIVKRIA